MWPSPIYWRARGILTGAGAEVELVDHGLVATWYQHHPARPDHALARLSFGDGPIVDEFEVSLPYTSDFERLAACVATLTRAVAAARAIEAFNPRLTPPASAERCPGCGEPVPLFACWCQACSDRYWPRVPDGPLVPGGSMRITGAEQPPAACPACGHAFLDVADRVRHWGACP